MGLIICFIMVAVEDSVRKPTQNDKLDVLHIHSFI